MAAKRLLYRIVSEPRRTSYEALIRYCAAEGATCTLADLLPASEAGRHARAAFLQRAGSHLAAVEVATGWPIGEAQTGNSGKPTSLWRFSLRDPALDFLLGGPVGLYGWIGPKFPEDLAFYRADGSVLLGTVAHEHIGWMNLSVQEAADTRLGLVELQPTGAA